MVPSGISVNWTKGNCQLEILYPEKICYKYKIFLDKQNQRFCHQQTFLKNLSWGNENILKWIMVMVVQVCEYAKSRWIVPLNGWIVWGIYYISIKLFFFKEINILLKKKTECLFLNECLQTEGSQSQMENLRCKKEWRESVNLSRH